MPEDRLPPFDDDLTPVPVVPSLAAVPLEVAMIKQTLKAHAALLRAIKAEREENRKGFRNVWLALLAVAVTVFLAAGAALVQMGQYMERVDNINATTARIEGRLDQSRRNGTLVPGSR